MCDGVKVKQEYTDSNGTLTTYYYAGGSYELQTDGSSESVRQYYALAGVTAGMREGTTFSWFLTDHLGSVVGVTDSTGAMVSTTRYSPFGDIRTNVGTVSQTDYGYTFQKNVSGMGLMDYRARYYSSLLGRFVQPDSIIPGAGNPQAWNRYSYTTNNPVKYIDPSGHMSQVDDGGSCAGITCLDYDSPIQLPTPTPTLVPLSTQVFPIHPIVPKDQNNTVEIGQKCTNSTPCWTDFEQPSLWDTDPKSPDYSSISVSYGAIFGITGTLTVDRYKNVYAAIGLNIGKSITPLSASWMNGFISDPFDDSYPSEGESMEFLSGLGVNGSVGVIGGGGMSWSPFGEYYVNRFSFEYGAVLIAQAGVSVNYSNFVPFLSK